MKYSSFFPILLFIPLSLAAEENTLPKAETIVDVNYEFLMVNPKTAWGPDLFKKRAGFAEFTQPEEKYTLQGIVYDRAGSSAVIDGKVVRSGDMLAERKVIEIGPNFVVLEKGDSQMQLVIAPPSAPPSAPSGSNAGKKP